MMGADPQITQIHAEDVNKQMEAANQKNWEIAHQWYSGVQMVYEGVNIGEAMTYDVLRVLGRQWQNHLTGGQDGQPAAN
jgi:hypothetical protein